MLIFHPKDGNLLKQSPEGSCIRAVMFLRWLNSTRVLLWHWQWTGDDCGRLVTDGNSWGGCVWWDQFCRNGQEKNGSAGEWISWGVVFQDWTILQPIENRFYSWLLTILATFLPPERGKGQLWKKWLLIGYNYQIYQSKHMWLADKHQRHWGTLENDAWIPITAELAR